MADNKDFLEQFSNSGKPESFKEEERIPVVKEKKPVNVKLVIILVVILLLLGVLGYFLFLAPKIEMPNFVGKTKTDVVAWVKQQGIETSGIIFEETYDFDTDEGTVLSQSVDPNKKVKENVKLNFLVSLGADPDERIKVPDLESMTKEEINEWISKNKLQKTKISTSYNDEVEENRVIDYTFTGCEEDSFTRACNLKVSVSKGPTPAGKVTVEDFENKLYEAAETWAKSKKINLIKSEAYSDKITEGYIISQSIAAGKTINEGESFSVVVSKGKATYMPNMIGWDEAQVSAWFAKNPGVSSYTKYAYSSSQKGVVVYQSIDAGKLINKDNTLGLTVSLGNEIDFSAYGSLEAIKNYLEEVNNEGASITLNVTKDFSETIPVGGIISSSGKVKVGNTLNVVVSRGKNILLKDLYDGTTLVASWDDVAANPTNYNEDTVKALCADNELGNIKIIYINSDLTSTNGVVVEIKRSDDIALQTSTYCPQDVEIIITVNDESR